MTGGENPFSERTLLYLLMEDVRQRAIMLENEIKHILQSAKYVSRLCEERSRRDFFTVVENMASDGLKRLQGKVLDKLEDEHSVMRRILKGDKQGPPKNPPFVLQRHAEYLLPLLLDHYVAKNREGYHKNGGLNDPVISTISRRAYYLREISIIIRYNLALCHKGLGQRIDHLPPYPFKPSLYARKGVRKGFEGVREITETYLKTTIDFLNRYLLPVNQRIAYERFQFLVVCDHIGLTQVRGFKPASTGEGLGEGISNFFIQAPSWLLGMPRYLPILVHEIAHILLKYTFAGQEIHEKAEFQELRNILKERIEAVIAHYAGDYYAQILHTPAEAFIEEILADIVAFLVAGPAYLFALFFSIISEEPITAYVLNTAPASHYVRLRVIISLFKEMYEGKEMYTGDGIIKEAVKATERILDDYEYFFKEGGWGKAGDGSSFKFKINYFNNLHEAIIEPMNMFFRSVKQDQKFKFANVREDTWTSTTRKVLKTLKDLQIPDLHYHICDYGGELRRNIPNLIWEYLLLNTEKFIKIDEVIPEARVLRELSKLVEAKMRFRLKLGDCYEMVFFKITGYKTRPVRKKQAKRDSSVIRSIGRELRDIIFEKSQANREGAFFFVFGEYDFLLIRNRYKARRSSQLPQIDQLDYDYHTKQYIYREIINLPQRDGKKKGFSEDLQLNMQGLEHTGLLAFSQVSFRKEIDAGKKEEVLYELFERAHRKQKDAVYPLAIFEGTSWDDLGIIWYLPKNIFSMKDIFEFLEHIDREELKDRSITHLAYSSCWKPKGTSRERINGTLGLEIGGQSLYALSRVIARLNPEEERKGIEIIKSSIEEQCKVRVKVFEALGLNDYTILWELESDNSINEIEQGLSVLIARGIVRDCTTEIIML